MNRLLLNYMNTPSCSLENGFSYLSEIIGRNFHIFVLVNVQCIGVQCIGAQYVHVNFQDATIYNKKVTREEVKFFDLVSS